MKYRFLELLRCPLCRARLEITSHEEVGTNVETGELRCESCDETWPIVHFIPRMVPRENYAGNFGLQWNKFRTTQLDSHSGVPISRARFYEQSGWDPADLRDKLVLDVGCGAGRFAEIALAAGAEVVALDYSTAVDACRENLGTHPRMHVVQGDIYQLPFSDRSFDYVYCFGVLQHTPQAHKAFLALPPMLREGGYLAVDVYPKLLRNLCWSKYWLRPLTKRLPAPMLFRAVNASIDALLRVSNTIRRIPALGSGLRYVVPVANYEGVYPLSEAQLREWAVLDTFDMLAPAHDHPQSRKTLERWLLESRLSRVEIARIGHLVGRGRRDGW